MPDNEVKIHISADGDLKTIEEAQRKLDELNRTKPASGSNPTPAQAKGSGPDDAERAAAKGARERAGEARNVSAESREQLGIEEKKKRIAELHKAANAYESKGMDTAARSARAEARPLEREVTQFTKERAAEEKRVTQELKEQAALRKAGIGRPGLLSSQAASVGKDILAGGNPTASIVGMGMSTGNPAAIVGAIAATVVTGAINTYFSQQEKGLEQQNQLNESRSREEFRRNRQMGVFGSSGGLVGDALAAEEERAQREAHQAELQRRTKFGWYNPLRWSDKLFGTKFQEEGISRGDAMMGIHPAAGLVAKAIAPKWAEKTFWKSDEARAKDTNEKEIERLKEEEIADKKAARKKFLAEEGGLELDALRQRAKRTIAGNRAAFVDEEAAKWMSKYKAVMRESGDENIAREMADKTVQNDLRDRQAAAGAGLVDARTGAAGVRAAAKWGMRATAGWDDVESRIGPLRGGGAGMASAAQAEMASPGGWKDVVSELGRVRHDMNQGNQMNQIHNHAK